VQLGNNKGEEI